MPLMRIVHPWRLLKRVVLVCAVGIAIFSARGGRWGLGDTHEWLRVARDSLYDVAIDTANISRQASRTYAAWYRTDHAMPRFSKGRRFDREVVQVWLQCDRLMYKVARVDLSMGSAVPISRQRTSDKELRYQQWRPIDAGTTEESAAKGTCAIARARTQRR